MSFDFVEWDYTFSPPRKYPDEVIHPPFISGITTEDRKRMYDQGLEIIARDKEFVKEIRRKNKDNNMESNTSPSAEDILRKCLAILEERGKLYGNNVKERNMERIVERYTQKTGKDMSVIEGWNFMISLKEIRRETSPKPLIDNFIDEINYIALKAEAELEEQHKHEQMVDKVQKEFTPKVFGGPQSEIEPCPVDCLTKAYGVEHTHFKP